MKILRENNSFTITDFVIDPKYNYSEYTRNDESTGRTYNVGDKNTLSNNNLIWNSKGVQTKSFGRLERKGWLSRSYKDNHTSRNQRN